jgi:mannose-6-phosphate isomerase-like protein (cupin superfamily)
MASQPGSADMIEISNAEHYVWGEGCEGWQLVRSADMSVIQERMPPRTSEVRHKHSRSHQFFHVIDGTATFERDGTVYSLEKEQGIEVLPGVSHQMCNASSSRLEFVVFSVPPSHGDRINEPPLRL